MTEHAHAADHAKHGIGRYLAVWIGLLVLTAVTVGVARVHIVQPWGLVVALAVAAVKATLVALFFMHLWDHGGASRLVLATTMIFVALLIGLVLVDNATRFPLANPPTEATMHAMPPGPDVVTPRLPAAPAKH